MNREGEAGLEAACTAYCAFMESLSVDSVSRLGEVMDRDIRFKDPFSEVRGLPAVERIFADMFRDLREPRFAVVDRARSGNRFYLRWEFSFRPRRLGPGEPWRFQGVSLVTFDTTGRAVEHIDFWDSGSEVYAKLPLLGGVVRALRRRLGHSQ